MWNISDWLWLYGRDRECFNDLELMGDYVRLIRSLIPRPSYIDHSQYETQAEGLVTFIVSCAAAYITTSFVMSYMCV